MNDSSTRNYVVAMPAASILRTSALRESVYLAARSRHQMAVTIQTGGEIRVLRRSSEIASAPIRSYDEAESKRGAGWGTLRQLSAGSYSIAMMTWLLRR